MVSERLLGEIEAAGLQYIVGVRMRRLKAAEAVLARAEVIHGEARYIVCLNPEEREHDRRIREEALAKLREKLAAGEAKQLIGNSAYRRYLKLDGAGLAINEAAAEDEARLDGKYVLRTNSSLDPEEVAQAYKSLWQVERAFRELKSGLDLRPV
jgi:IS4 transposase